MEYRKFVVHQYRAVSADVELDVGKHGLIPIIGVNECGKTTILEAIFAFDHFNDELNQGAHLDDIDNLYTLRQSTPRVSADVEAKLRDLVSVVDEAIVDEKADRESALKAALAVAAVKTQKDPAGALRDALAGVKALGEGASAAAGPGRPPDVGERLASFSERLKAMASDTSGDEEVRLRLTRDIRARRYSLEFQGHRLDRELSQYVSASMLRRLPWIIYFDDFRHSVPEAIEIVREDASEWLKIIDVLFDKCGSEICAFDLIGMEERKRKTALAKATKLLNDSLTRQWQNFHLGDGEVLRVVLTYRDPATEDGRARLSFDVVERDNEDAEHFFYIRNRSKGFFWFFNFVMRLEFNPKTVAASSQGPIYLLDEPGSYLHAAVQAKLCTKLRDLARDSIVIYCTHSHHLLDPDVIPINAVRIASRDAGGSVRLRSIFDHDEPFKGGSAFQPIVDALQVRPSILDLSTGRVLVTEGLSDYFCYTLMRPEGAFHVLPSVGAGALHRNLALLMAWNVDYRALWDDDAAGREAMARATEFFGEGEAQRRFHLLPRAADSTRRKRVLQDLFSAQDLQLLRRELSLGENTKFHKVVLAWFYSPMRGEIAGKLSRETKQAFAHVFEVVWAEDYESPAL